MRFQVFTQSSVLGALDPTTKALLRLLTVDATTTGGGSP